MAIFADFTTGFNTCTGGRLNSTLECLLVRLFNIMEYFLK